MRRVLLTSLALLLACGGSAPTATKAPVVNGTWRGASSSGVVLILSIGDQHGFVHGTATLGDGVPNSLVVDGVFAAPNLSVTISKSGLSSAMTLTGAIDADRLGGTLNGAGYTDLALNLYRDR